MKRFFSIIFFVMCVVAVSAQQKITGEVVDADGYAIPLASGMA